MPELQPFGTSAALARTIAVVNADPSPAALQATLARFGDAVALTEIKSDWSATCTVIEMLRALLAIADADQAAAAINAALASSTDRLQLVIEPGAAWHLHADPPGPERLSSWLAASSVLAVAIAFAERGRPGWATCDATGCDRPYLIDGPGRQRATCSPRCASRRRQAAYRARARPESRSKR